MTPATAPRARASAARLMVIDTERSSVSDARTADLGRILDPGDLLVVNDAATLPASFRGRTARADAVEVRLAGPPEDGRCRAVLFGPGDWRERTEDRRPPPGVRSGETIVFAAGRAEAKGSDLSADIVSVSPLSPRLVTLWFDREGATLWEALYRLGRPVQYSYLRAPLELWDVQTPYASRP